MNTISSEIRRYAPAIALDRMIHRSVRRRVLRLLGAAIVLLCISILGFVAYDSMSSGQLTTSSVFGSAQYLTAALLILIGPYVTLLQLSFFYNTLYYRGCVATHREDAVDTEGTTFEVASVCARGTDDLTKSFLSSTYGSEVMLRLEITTPLIEAFLQSPRTHIPVNALVLVPHTFLTLHDVGMFLFESDTSYKAFLFAHGVHEKLFRGASEWVSRMRLVHKSQRRWWSRDTLGKIRGIGRDFSYGIAYELAQYVRSVDAVSGATHQFQNVAYANEIITKIETILTRSQAANVIMAGDPGVGKMEMLAELGRKMREGKSVASLSAKHLVVFDADAFIATHNTKEKFEYSFLALMASVERAGNIVMVIKNFSSFLGSVNALGVDAGELIGRFLISKDVQIIATADTRMYHQALEHNLELLKHFEPIIIEEPDLSSTVRVLEEATRALEYQYRTFFTYPAIVRVAESADQYIVDGVMPDKAISLLSEVASQARGGNIALVEESFVNTCVTQKTGIPTGPIQDQERDTLVHLEDVLHERIVGQHDAIQVIASTMRRSRAGIQSKDKPIGSFLFLGSTGVGKTETAKALAHTFFGNEQAMVRFDMSEFSDESGLARLIGTQELAGALSSALREHPYCVLLLDEFEKAATGVHDLFLQLLDEGGFTDARGTHINARNTIVIATSNAGSDLLWQFAQEGKRPEDAKDIVVNSIIEKHIFRPELVNRFDAVVLFETLSPDQQRKIAGLMLTELVERIRGQGYELVVDDTLLNVLMKEGYDPQFGARPMRRAIQDIIEEKVALKIIEGGLRPGDSIHFTESDFAETSALQ